MQRWRQPRLRATPERRDEDRSGRADAAGRGRRRKGERKTTSRPKRPRNVSRRLLPRNTGADRQGKTALGSQGRDGRRDPRLGAGEGRGHGRALPRRRLRPDPGEPGRLARGRPPERRARGRHRRSSASSRTKYPPQVADQVEEECLNILGQSLVAKVVHAQSLSAHVPREEVEASFLSSIALTTAALGMVYEAEGVSIRIGGVLGIKKAL